MSLTVILFGSSAWAASMRERAWVRFGAMVGWGVGVERADDSSSWVFGFLVGVNKLVAV